MLSKPFEYKIIHYSTTLSIQSLELTCGGTEQGGGIVGLWADRLMQIWFFFQLALQARNNRAGTTQALTPVCIHLGRALVDGVKEAAMGSWDCVPWLTWAAARWPVLQRLGKLQVRQWMPHSPLPLEHDLLVLVEVKRRIKREHSQPCDLSPADSVSCMPSSGSGNTALSTGWVMNSCSAIPFCADWRSLWDRRGSGELWTPVRH